MKQPLKKGEKSRLCFAERKNNMDEVLPANWVQWFETTEKVAFLGWFSCVQDTGQGTVGNYTYGYLGFAYGIPLDHLLAGSYYAAKYPTEYDLLRNELWDWQYIQLGYLRAEGTGR